MGNASHAGTERSQNLRKIIEAVISALADRVVNIFIFGGL
jgi:hypothetical protein